MAYLSSWWVETVTSFFSPGCLTFFILWFSKTATKGDVKHSVLFDTGPEEEAWERNVKRLRADLSRVELIQLSHWHRDHSGWFLACIEK